jgi:tryptophan 2,3-dioxygenase
MTTETSESADAESADATGSSGGKSFGEEGRRLSYGSYLKVPELLGLQEGLSDAHDELLFIVVHQAYELWFKVLIDELEAARDRIDADDMPAARHHFRRVASIERLLVQQVDVLETMTPQDFLVFRSNLAPASGFQSVQFRELEFLSGLKDPDYLDRVETTPDERARLERRLAEPSLWDAYVGLVQRKGDPSFVDVLHDRWTHGDLFDLAEALLDHDEAVAMWRSRHVLMVERMIGSKAGTGGSSGAQYLRGTLTKRFFPELWAARDAL